MQLAVQMNGGVFYRASCVRKSCDRTDIRFVSSAAVRTERNPVGYIYIYVFHGAAAKVSCDYTRAYLFCADSPVVTVV